MDKEYLQWMQELCKRYRQSQIKAVEKVNQEMLRFYRELGRDIVLRHEENSYGSEEKSILIMVFVNLLLILHNT